MPPYADIEVRHAYQREHSKKCYKNPEWLAKHKEYMERTKERRRATQKAYREANKEKLAEYNRSRKDILLAKAKERRKNPDSAWRKYYEAKKKDLQAYYRSWSKEYYAKHPEKRYRWREHFPERALESYRQWTARNRHKVQESQRARRARKPRNQSAEAFYKSVRARKRIRCYYCKEYVSGAEAHIDHVIALAKDGNHASENLCASCPRCNLKKHAKLPSEITFLQQPLLNL